MENTNLALVCPTNRVLRINVLHDGARQTGVRPALRIAWCLGIGMKTGGPKQFRQPSNILVSYKPEW